MIESILLSLRNSSHMINVAWESDLVAPMSFMVFTEVEFSGIFKKKKYNKIMFFGENSIKKIHLHPCH